MAAQNKSLTRLTPLVQAVMALLGAAVCLQAGPATRAKPAIRTSLTLAAARQRVLAARPLKMYYYSEDTRALESLQTYAQSMTLLAPQCFWIDAEGFVHGTVPPRVAEIARRARLPVMPLLINPGFDRPTASAMLRSAKAQQRAITYLVYLAKRDNYVGWQIDLEYIDPADKKLFTRFVQRAAARLHREGRLLSVAVVPRFSDDYPDDPPGEFKTGEWGAPYDYQALGRVADFVTLMTYDQSSGQSPAGPIAGYAWVKKALDYAVRRVARPKLLLGIPFYGREWVDIGQGTISRNLTFKDAHAMLAQADVEAQWDERWRSPWFQHRDESAQRTVWFEDRRSLGEKLQLMREHHLRGFAAWRLGVEDPQFWPLAAALGRGRSTGSRPEVRKMRARAAPGGPGSRPQ